MYLTYELIRPTADDADYLEVQVDFYSKLIARGYRATWEEPGCADEWEHVIHDIDIVERDKKYFTPLTEAEIATIRAWFAEAAQQERADEQAREDQMDCAV
jgi:hypothetical protein